MHFINQSSKSFHLFICLCCLSFFFYYFTTVEKFISRLKDYEIVIPYQVDKGGEFISHVIRQKNHRSTAETKNVHYKIPAFGKQLHLELSKETTFLSPGLIIEEEKTQRQVNHSCHFTGRLKDQPGSPVFVSNCRGLVSHMNKGILVIYLKQLPPNLQDIHDSKAYKPNHTIAMQRVTLCQIRRTCAKPLPCDVSLFNITSLSTIFEHFINVLIYLEIRITRKSTSNSN